MLHISRDDDEHKNKYPSNHFYRQQRQPLESIGEDAMRYVGAVMLTVAVMAAEL
jgi:hypothetical protein